MGRSVERPNAPVVTLSRDAQFFDVVLDGSERLSGGGVVCKLRLDKVIQVLDGLGLSIMYFISSQLELLYQSDSHSLAPSSSA